MAVGYLFATPELWDALPEPARHHVDLTNFTVPHTHTKLNPQPLPPPQTSPPPHPCFHQVALQ